MNTEACQLLHDVCSSLVVWLVTGVFLMFYVLYDASQSFAGLLTECRYCFYYWVNSALHPYGVAKSSTCFGWG